MDGRINMSLDDIISSTRKKGSGERGSRPAKRGNTRQERSTAPYSKPKPSSTDGDLSIKFLLSNSEAGFLIGKGGSSIRKLMELSEAKVNISNFSNCYPGTECRVAQISGSQEAVDLSQTMIWEAIALAAQSSDVSWVPRKKLNPSLRSSEVEGVVAIPASAAGNVIGRGGATIRGISEESGASASMSSKEDSSESQERTLIISGLLPSCVKFVSLLVAKFAEEPEDAQFVHVGGSYGTNRQTKASTAGGAGGAGGGGGSTSRLGRSQQEQGQTRGGAGRVRGLDVAGGSSFGAEVMEANTTFTLAVPDALVGAILGPKGAMREEVMSMSGATLSVSNRGDLIPGTTNRTVTISGPPANAQTAYQLVTHLLQKAAEEDDA